MFRYECSFCFKEILKNVLFKSPVRCDDCFNIKIFEKVVLKHEYFFQCQHCGKNIESNPRDKSCVECRKINKIKQKKFCLGCSFFMGQNKAGRMNSTCQHCHITSSFFSSK